MIGSGLKKLARENGMTVYGGVAYGSLRGFAATLSEGAGYKKIDFATSFPDMAGLETLRARLGEANIRANYRVQNISFGAKVIQVTFHDTMGTMKKIRAFVDFFTPLLEEAGATRADICAECGGQMAAPRWVQVNGVCHAVHDTCAQRVQMDVDAGNAQRQEADQGNYISGALGALAGALLGAVVWALLLNAGYVAALVGWLIGWLAEKGYNLAKGRQGKGKTWILILTILLSIVLGTFGADAIEIGKLLLEGSLPGFGFGDIPMFILALFVDNAEYRSAVISNLGMGALFAALGVFTVVQQTARDVSGKKFRYMK